MEIIYRKAAPEDAVQLLDYLKIVGGESDNLTFGSSGIPLSVEQEKQILAGLERSPHSTMLLACDGGRIVGNACLQGTSNPRFCHRATLAISVRKEFWGRGIGSRLIEALIAYAKQSGLEILSLEVRSDNARAKALYRKFGFSCFGIYHRYFKFGKEYFDVDLMNLSL